MSNYLLAGRSGCSCPNCGRWYMRRESMNRHRNFECGQEPKFKCLLCPKLFKRKDKLREHEKKDHLKDPLLLADQQTAVNWTPAHHRRRVSSHSANDKIKHSPYLYFVLDKCILFIPPVPGCIVRIILFVSLCWSENSPSTELANEVTRSRLNLIFNFSPFTKSSLLTSVFLKNFVPPERRQKVAEFSLFVSESKKISFHSFSRVWTGMCYWSSCFVKVAILCLSLQRWICSLIEL